MKRQKQPWQPKSKELWQLLQDPWNNLSAQCNEKQCASVLGEMVLFYIYI